MTKMHTLGITLLLAVSASSLAQDKAAPATPAAKPAVAAPAPAPKPAVAPAPAAAAAAAPAAAPAPAAPPAAKPAAAAAAPAAAPAPAPSTSAKADVPKKKRAVKRKPKTACTKLDDPWDNVCQVQKNAQAACKDLPVGKKAAKAKRGKAPVVATENRRQQCVDNYMRNV